MTGYDMIISILLQATIIKNNMFQSNK